MTLTWEQLALYFISITRVLLYLNLTQSLLKCFVVSTKPNVLPLSLCNTFLEVSDQKGSSPNRTARDP